ncbi:MAG: histidine kinase dimerization/phosphoacceptor domain -containing protein [Cyclobacteriaceae bacterium]
MLVTDMHPVSPSSEQRQVATGETNLKERYDALLKKSEEYKYDQADSALLAGLELVTIAAEIDDPALAGEANRLVGRYYRDLGIYDQAIEHFYRSIDNFEKAASSENNVQIARTYHDIAWVHVNMKELAKARDMFHNSIAEYTSSDLENIMTSYHALGSFYYLDLVNYDSAVHYLKKAIHVGESLSYGIEELAEPRLELCHVLILDDKFDTANNILFQMKSFPQDSLSNYSLAYISFLEGLMLDANGEYDQALLVFEPVYSWIQSASLEGSSTGQNLIKQMISTAYRAGQFQLAFHYLERLKELEAATIFKDRQRLTKTLEIQYETKRKEQILSNQKEQIILQGRILFVSVVGLLLVGGLLVWLYRVYQRVDSKNKKIEMLMRELHHRVKNNLQVISSLLGLQSMKLEDADAQKAVAEGKERIRAMSLIHQKLYQEENVTAVNIKEYMQNLVSELSNSYGYHDKAKIIVDVPDLAMDADTTLPLGLIVNELVSNAFKYAYKDIEKPVLELKFIQENKLSKLLIKDNGKGMPVGFDLSSAQSFGLKLVNLLAKQLNGNITVRQEGGLEYLVSFAG